jgi:hypothetical protein
MHIYMCKLVNKCLPTDVCNDLVIYSENTDISAEKNITTTVFKKIGIFIRRKIGKNWQKSVKIENSNHNIEPRMRFMLATRASQWTTSSTGTWLHIGQGDQIWANFRPLWDVFLLSVFPTKLILWPLMTTLLIHYFCINCKTYSEKSTF